MPDLEETNSEIARFRQQVWACNKNIATCLNFSTSPKFGCGHLFWMMIPIPAASQNSQKKPGLGCAALALVSSCFHPDHDGILGGHSEPAPASAPSTGCLLLFSCDGWMVPNNRILFLGGGCPAGTRICNLIASTCFSSSGRGGKKHVKKHMSLRNRCGNLFWQWKMSLSWVFVN